MRNDQVGGAGRPAAIEVNTSAAGAFRSAPPKADSRRLRVVHVISGLSQGGAEAMLEKLIVTGRRLNPEINQEVIVLGRLGVVGARLVGAGIRVDALELRFSVAALARLPRIVAAIVRLRRPAIILTWLWHADVLGATAATLVGNRRIVWNLRNAMPGDNVVRTSPRLAARICAVLSRWLPRRIVCNSSAAAAAHAAAGYQTGKFVIIPNGFDIQEFRRSDTARDELRHQWGMKQASIVVGMVARLDPMKDHETFVRAAACVIRDIPQARFVLVGDGIPESRRLKLLISALGVASHFVLQGRHDRISRVMSALDVHCLSSLSEGFPNVLGEAMSCGTPSVTTDAGDARKIVGDDRLVAPVSQPVELAARIVRVARMSADERRELGETQRRAIESRYEISLIWERYRQLYMSL